jgi:hypothetical protein
MGMILPRSAPCAVQRERVRKPMRMLELIQCLLNVLRFLFIVDFPVVLRCGLIFNNNKHISII